MDKKSQHSLKFQSMFLKVSHEPFIMCDTDVDSIDSKSMLEKIKELFDLYNKNYNFMDYIKNTYDLQRFLEYIGMNLTRENFLEYHRILGLLTERSLFKSINITYNLTSNFNFSYHVHSNLRKMMNARMELLQKQKQQEQIYDIMKYISDGGSSITRLINEYQENIAGKVIPEHVYQIFQENMGNLMIADPRGMEFAQLKRYLNNLTTYPFGVMSETEVNLQKAFDILGKPFS